MVTETKNSRKTRQSEPPPRRYINERTLEAMTGIAAMTWQKKRVMGTGPRYYKLGGAVRYDLDEVLAWIREQARGN